MSAGIDCGWRSLPRISAASTRTLYERIVASDSSTSWIPGPARRGPTRRATATSPARRRAAAARSGGRVARHGQLEDRLSRPARGQWKLEGTRVGEHRTCPTRTFDAAPATISARLFGRRRRRIHVSRAACRAIDTEAPDASRTRAHHTAALNRLAVDGGRTSWRSRWAPTRDRGRVPAAAARGVGGARVRPGGRGAPADDARRSRRARVGIPGRPPRPGWCCG